MLMGASRVRTGSPVDTAYHEPTAATRLDSRVRLTEEDLAIVSADGHTRGQRKVVIVTGPPSSSAPLMAGILTRLGLQSPVTDVGGRPDPQGHGESRWVVDFHDRLLDRVLVQPADGRPSAWFDTGVASTREHNRTELTSWLTEQLDVSESLVVTESRISWFLGLWRVAAVRCAASIGTVTMLHPPEEVLGEQNDVDRAAAISGLAGWVNGMLSTERATRGSRRAFVRHHDLLDDWTKTVVRVGEALQLSEISDAGVGRMQEVHRLLEPEQRRVRLPGESLSAAGVPGDLRQVAEDTWTLLDRLAEPGGDTAELHAALDGLRREYAALYGDAEAFARSSIETAGPAFLRATRQARAAEAETAARVAYDSAPAARRAYLRSRRVAGGVKRRMLGRD
jgi:hypothetical protein